MRQPTRRVVTGHDAKGRAVVLIDGAAQNVKLRKATGLVSTLLWVTEESPADVSGNADRASRETGVAPPPRGSIFRVVDFPPAADFGAVDNAAMLREMGIAAGRGDSRHASMHRTKSIDYAVVISGEIDMLLDDSEVHLKAGDVLVQRGTNHGGSSQGGRRAGAAGDEPLLGEQRKGKLPDRFRAHRCEGAGVALRRRRSRAAVDTSRARRRCTPYASRRRSPAAGRADRRGETSLSPSALPFLQAARSPFPAG